MVYIVQKFFKEPPPDFNSCTKFVVLDIKYRFTCGVSNLNKIIKKCQNIMTRIVGVLQGTALNGCVCMFYQVKELISCTYSL